MNDSIGAWTPASDWAGELALARHAASELDQADALAGFRTQFHVPRVRDVARALGLGSGGEEECIYLVGNSLGLQPISTRSAIEQELDDWARLGVEGHFHARHPWFPYHEEVREMLARVVGALPREVVAMNSLTTNLHLLMASFYRPTRGRYRIVIEDGAFPSDSYAVQSQADFHAPHVGFDPAHAVLRLAPRASAQTLRTEDILEAIERERHSIALLLLGGVNYRTGQCFRMGEITAFARERGIAVGWDLAHAAGNVELALHDWAPDFAAWCSYKYLNSGPGAIAGAFVHERHLDPPASTRLPRLAGWWGNDPATRFKMEPGFVPAPSADAWALSNPPILATAPLRESLRLFDRAGMPALRGKSRGLTRYLDVLLAALNRHATRSTVEMAGAGPIEVITPEEHDERGCQFSIRVRAEKGGAEGGAQGAGQNGSRSGLAIKSGRELHRALSAAGVVTDFREPDVIRAAPTPLYNTYHDCWRLAEGLGRVLGVGVVG